MIWLKIYFAYAVFGTAIFLAIDCLCEEWPE